MIRISNILISPEGGDEAALKEALRRLKLKETEAAFVRIARKSVDARDKAAVMLNYAVDVGLSGKEAAHLDRVRTKDAHLFEEPPRMQVKSLSHKPRPVVAGLGPCGLFAALHLARAGLSPLVLERGKPVQERARDVNRLFHQGELHADSNIQFGEGGAGTFSDGKLTTGTKSPLIHEVLSTLVAHGAPEEILCLQRPHLGTDKLPKIVSSLRTEIEALGGEVRFESKLSGLHIQGGALRGIAYLAQGERVEIPCDRLILALGHSARDTQAMLHQAGIDMQQKPLSIGLRLEQKQSIIDRAQYGRYAGHRNLPAAEYHLAHRTASGRGVYSFCMCPGGQVVNAASEQGHLCCNGMSAYSRDGENANAAILVDVRPEDFGDGHPLQGFLFQREYERRAFLLGGGAYLAPAQLADDFLKGIPSRQLQDVRPSILPGVMLCDLQEALPAFAVTALREALPVFACKLQGFLSGGALLTGVETRSSSPLRVPRSPGLEANVRGVYPAGEGAGMAGGIMSAAVDGLKAALALCEGLGC